MLHPIKVPSCAPALKWLVQLQRDILTKLCAPTTTKTIVTPKWVAAIRPDCASWLERFAGRTHNKTPLLSAMRAISSASRSQKRSIFRHFTNSQAFTEAFDLTITRPKIFSPVENLANATLASHLRNFLDAFYEIALQEGLPIDAHGNPGQSFSRQQFVEFFQQENYGRVCPLCDGDMNGPEVDHWLPKSKYPSLSCHQSNLVPICHRCNSRECKGERCPLDEKGHQPFDNWFHPYKRPAHGNFSVRVNGVHVSLFNIDPAQQTRLNNLDRLINLSQRWSEEYRSQKGNYLRQLAGKVRREKLKPTTEDVLEVIKEWLEAIVDEKTQMPHSIIRRVVLERVNTKESPDFDGWLKHAEEALT